MDTDRSCHADDGLHAGQCGRKSGSAASYCCGGTVAARLTQSTEEAQPEETATQQATESITNTPTGTPTTPPTSPPAVTATNTATSIPCNKAQFVSDITYPDDTEVTKNTAFVKTWRLKNTGSCTWTSGYRLVFSHGDQMGAPGEVSFTSGTVAPGQTVDVSVNLTAPSSNGTYRGDFRLKAPDGQIFGIGANADSSFYVQIKTVTGMLPLITVQPLPTMFIATNFTPKYQQTIDCTGNGLDYLLSFKIKNTGTFSLESFKIVVQDTTMNQTYQQTDNFIGMGSVCIAMVSNSLLASDSGYLRIQIPDPVVGHQMKANFKGCTQDNLGGICVEKSINFITTMP